jgi:16S rRNA (adenine1518-N6/adenine1519-N6)-dimethyltransferase
MIARVPKGAFTPPPSVESAILAIYNISGDKFGNDDKKIKRFFSIVKAGFAHKRKILKRNLESVIEIERIDKIWSFYKIDPNIRAEDVSLDLWLKMALFID